VTQLVIDKPLVGVHEAEGPDPVSEFSETSKLWRSNAIFSPSNSRAMKRTCSSIYDTSGRAPASPQMPDVLPMCPKECVR
jgi:hypothetical protein